MVIQLIRPAVIQPGLLEQRTSRGPATTATCRHCNLKAEECSIFSGCQRCLLFFCFAAAHLEVCSICRMFWAKKTAKQQLDKAAHNLGDL